MPAHAPLAHLFPRSSHPVSTRGHTLGAPRFYDAVANVFFFGRRRATFQVLLAATGVQAGQRVLDVGCGTGYFARLLARAVGPDGVVVGLDASPEMIGYAAHQLNSVTNCQFQVGTAESLDFPAEHFDVVVSTLFMHHLPADLQRSALQEMRRVLRPGGALLVADVQIPRAFGWRALAMITGHLHMARMTPQLEPLATRAGFAEVRGGEAPPWLRYVHAVKSSTGLTAADGESHA
jgi:ubiquinone/menaquinone biosynthesis C-methylase UbiE